jgi:hypothetical protein
MTLLFIIHFPPEGGFLDCRYKQDHRSCPRTISVTISVMALRFPGSKSVMSPNSLQISGLTWNPGCFRTSLISIENPRILSNVSIPICSTLSASQIQILLGTKHASALEAQKICTCKSELSRNVRRSGGDVRRR